MKIKARPEDFTVEEEIDGKIEKKGAYALYLLQKKGENTVGVLRKLSDSLKVPFSSFSYGGRKDKHALTFQHIAIKKQKPPKIIESKNFSLKLLGFLGRPMGPDLIKGNRFNVAIRQLTLDEKQLSQSQLPIIEKYGFANYFDDQRFGAFDARGGFLAEKILKQHFNGALKTYLTRIALEDDREERNRKNFFFENWNKWDECLKKTGTDYEKFAFQRLKDDPKGFIDILRKIPRSELSPHYTSYQGYLWNEVLRRWIKLCINTRLKNCRGILGDYLFYETLDDQKYARWKETNLPMPASNIKITDQDLEKCYKEVLAENDLKLPMFNITKIRQAFFKGNLRPVLVTPQSLSFETCADEMSSGHWQLKLKFFLPRGSYATMLIKRIFSAYSS